MNEYQLELVKTVAEQKSLTKAAHVLFTTPANVKSHLDNVEKEIGAALFVRTNKGCELTASGEAFLGRARTLLDQFALLRSDVRESSIPRVLRLATLPGSLFTLRDAICAAYTKVFPSERIQYVTSAGNPVQSCIDGKADIALASSEWAHLEESGFEFTSFGIEVPFVCVMRDDDPLARKEIVAADDLDLDRVVYAGFATPRTLKTLGVWRSIASETYEIANACKESLCITSGYQEIGISGLTTIPFVNLGVELGCVHSVDASESVRRFIETGRRFGSSSDCKSIPRQDRP